MTTPTSRRSPDAPTVAVVGAGLAGLATAALLARSGLDVHVYEGGGTPGGRARTTVGDGGHRRNLGPHALFLRGPGLGVLRSLGIEPPGASPDLAGLRFATHGRLQRSGGPRGLVDLTRLVRALDRVDPADPGSAATSVDDWVAAHDLDPRRAGALANISTYAADRARLSVGLLATQHRATPVRYVHGGWATLVQALQDAATGHGARIHLGQKATAVLGDERVVGVVVAGRDLPVDAVVLAAGGPRAALELLPAPAAATLATATAGMVPVHAATLDLALAPGRPGASLVLGLDRDDYLSDHGIVARLAPDGHTVVHVARYLPTDGKGDATVRAELEDLLDLAWPGWRPRVVEAGWRPHLTVSHDLAPVARGGLRGRTGATATGMHGVVLAGDWVGPVGHLADAVLASASHAADHVLSVLNSTRPTRVPAARSTA